MTQKIDKRILNQISMLSLEGQIDCFVYVNNLSSARRFLITKGIHIENEYPFINAVFCKATKKQILLLPKSKDVEFVSSMSTASSMMFVSKKILQLHDDCPKGDGVGVAFIDTGVAPHCDFMIGQNRVEVFKDFINGKKDPYDDNGHGTFVCGVCSGSGCLSKFKFSGVAPKSKIFALKALNGHGEANANKILEAMQWLFENHKKMGIKVVCMSFGSEPLGVNDPIMIGADALWNDGVVVVAAAGNSGPEFQTIKSPGISSKIITVGGIDDNRIDEATFDKKFFEIAEFSSRGPAFRKIKPDIVAPSVDITSCGNVENYSVLSGTSVAAPMIAGLCCLLLEKFPSFRPDKIKNLLLEGAQPLGFEMNLEGFGVPNFANIFKRVCKQ